MGGCWHAGLCPVGRNDSIVLLQRRGRAARAATQVQQLLQESYPQEVRDQQPIYIKGDSLSGQPDLKASVHGEAELRRGDTMIRADKLDYAVPDDRINAVGSVHINQAGNVYEGTALDLQMDAFKGQFDNANYRFLATGGHGESSRVDFHRQGSFGRP
jgi:LPS-assembly protein